MTIDIRAMAETDAPAVRTVITEAFHDDGRVVGLADALRARTDLQAGLVATLDGVVIGHTHLSVSWVDAPAAVIEVLVLSPLSVAPRHQGRGIGGRLQAAALDAARDAGVPLVFLEGDPAYYSRHGWRAGADLGFTAPSERIPAPGFQVFPLPAYDAATMTGRLIYNDTFWVHDCVGLRG